MNKIRPIISLWFAVYLLAAVMCGQLDAIKSFYSDVNHLGPHIESVDPSDNDFAETKHISFIPDYFDLIPFFKPTLITVSCSQLVFQYPPIYKSVIPTEFCGRAPPA